MEKINYGAPVMQAGDSKSPVNILHHVGVINKDLKGLADVYEKLGFSLTPISTPKIIINPGGAPVALGVSNRHAIFTNNYLELLGITDINTWSRLPKEKLGPYNIDKPLSRYEGLHVMHFGTNHIELAKDQLTQRKIPSSDIKQFERNVLTPGGEKTMKARSIFFPAELTPEGLVQIAQHDTPELVFQPPYMHHSNGALELTEIILCCEDIHACAARYSNISGHETTQITDDCYMINLGYSQVKIVSRKGLEQAVPGCEPETLPFMAAFTIKTADINLARNTLKNNGVPFIERNSSIIIGCKDAGGCAIIFI